MTLYRCFGWNARAKPTDPDGALWIPRLLQGDGRHDNPDIYGCLYLADREVSAAVEQLARFRSQRLQPALLRRRALPLAVATFELDERAQLIDLDDPRTLSRERLRPSLVATRQREVTQPQVRKLHDEHRQASGLRWWSAFEASWMNVTLFDRAVHSLSTRDVRALTVDDLVVIEAADFLGLRR